MEVSRTSAVLVLGTAALFGWNGPEEVHPTTTHTDAVAELVADCRSTGNFVCGATLVADQRTRRALHIADITADALRREGQAESADRAWNRIAEYAYAVNLEDLEEGASASGPTLAEKIDAGIVTIADLQGDHLVC